MAEGWWTVGCKMEGWEFSCVGAQGTDFSCVGVSGIEYDFSGASGVSGIEYDFSGASGVYLDADAHALGSSLDSIVVALGKQVLDLLRGDYDLGFRV